MKKSIYWSISLMLLLGIYAPTNSGFSQTAFNTNLTENSGRENFLSPIGPIGQNEKVDPKVADKILQGEKDARQALKEKGKQLLVTALPTAPNQLMNTERNSIVSSNGVASPPSTVTWEFPSDVLVSGASNLQAEPDVISSEINDGNLVASTINYDSGSARCTLYSSSNAGASWTNRGNMQLPPGTSFQSDPSLATNSKGEFVSTCMAYDEDANGDFTSSAIIMQTSKDKGVTWSSPTIVAGSTSDISPIFHDKPWIASDANVHSPYRDRTYMCWTKFDFSQGITKIMVKKIQTSIGSEKTLITAGQDPDDIAQGCNVAVGPRGEVAVAWYTARATDPSTQGRIMISLSYDGGQSWTSGKTIATFTRIPPCSVFFYGCLSGVNGEFRVNQWPDISWDRLDNLLITYMDYASGNPDIRFTSSSNCATPSGACTFISPVKVNNDGTSRDQFFPAIIASDKISTVDDRGIVHIVAQDKREDSSNLFWRPWSYHCNLSSGCDSSGDWSGSNPQVGISRDLFSNEGLGFFVGDYNGLTTGDGNANDPSLNRQAHAIWFDNVGSPDIFSDRTTN